MTNQLTGKAKRQRHIITIIGTANVAERRTKVEISKKIGVANKQPWKNLYSGVYEDIEKILLPQKIIEEEGRIPIKRGPRLLQDKGKSYYKLTKTGILLLFCIDNGKIGIDFTEFTHQYDLGKELNLLCKISPSLCFLLLEKYVSTYYVEGEKIVPITLENISKVAKLTLNCNIDFIKSILSYDRDNQREILKIISYIDSKH